MAIPGLSAFVLSNAAGLSSETNPKHRLSRVSPVRMTDKTPVIFTRWISPGSLCFKAEFGIRKAESDKLRPLNFGRKHRKVFGFRHAEATWRSRIKRPQIV
jgi:hypothetical protein